MTRTAEGGARQNAPNAQDSATGQAPGAERSADRRPFAACVLEAAITYAAAGWPVFPCTPGQKEPAGQLAPHGFKDATTDVGVILGWWSRCPDANVAIATGAPAVDVVDVDVKPNGTGWPAFNRAKRAGLLAGAVALVRTRNGGLHAYYPGTGQRNGSVKGHFLDFRASGGYVLAPPSRVPADMPGGSGAYEWLDTRAGGKPVDWPAIVALLDPPKPAAPTRARPPRSSPGTSPGDDFNARAQWADILTPHGWRVHYTRGEVTYWTRPGKASGVSASTNATGTDRMHVFTTSTVLDADDSYSKFFVFAALSHGGDLVEAARELRRRGYGGAR